MQTVRFLREHGLAALESRYAIQSRRHGSHPQLVQLKYNQIASPMGEPIVRECRGLVVDESDDWRVVGRAYDKFFNAGEPHADPIDWSTATVYEKLDGSIMTLYWYRDGWHVASSGLPDAGGRAHDDAHSFAGLFRRTWADLGYRWPDAGDRGRCFIFELMTPHNRVIVPHDRSRIVLHGVRNLQTMQEEPPEPAASEYGWECVESHPIGTAEACLEAAKCIDPLRGEGYIVRDSAFRRVKIKSPKYVALTHLKSAMTGRRMLEIVRANESDEFLAYFPQFKPAYAALHAALGSLCAEVEADLLRLCGIADQKAFAAEALQTRCPSALFAIRAGKADSARAFFAVTTLPLVERSLGVDLEAVRAMALSRNESES